MSKINLKISSGSKKGTILLVPNGIEPVKNVVKLAIFSMLGDKINGANCLDLFCGSGNLGLEALSLGAKSCTFVDREGECIKCVKENVKKLNFESNSTICNSDIKDFLNSSPPTIYDVVFLDPPYKQTIDNIAKKLINCINESGVIIYLHHKNTNVVFNNLKTLKQRVYGITQVDIMTNSKFKYLKPFEFYLPAQAGILSLICHLLFEF